MKKLRIWALQLGRPGREFIAFGGYGLLATCHSRKAMRAWIKEKGYDKRKVWKNARIVCLEVVTGRKKP